MQSNDIKTAQWKKLAAAGVLAIAAIAVLAVKLQTKSSALAEEPQKTFQS